MAVEDLQDRHPDTFGGTVLRLRLRLLPLDGSSPVDVGRKMLIPGPFPPIPRVGDRFATYYDPVDADRFVVVTRVFSDTPPYVRDLFDRCRTSPYPPVCCPATGSARRRRGYRHESDRQPLFTDGQPAEATVVDVVPDGELMIGSSVWVHVRLAPLDDSATVAVRRLMPFEELTVPWLGDPFAAFYDPDEPVRFALVTAVDAGVPPRAQDLHRRLRAAPPSVGRVLPQLMEAMVLMGERREAWQAGRLGQRDYQRQYYATFPYR